MILNNRYCNRIVDVCKAVRAIESRDRVVFGHAAGCPRLVPKEMLNQLNRLKDIQIYHMLTLGADEHLRPETEGHFRHVTNFVGANSRAAIAEGRGDFLPIFFYEVPSLFTNEYPVDVAVIQVSKPDENGNCCLGV